MVKIRLICRVFFIRRLSIKFIVLTIDGSAIIVKTLVEKLSSYENDYWDFTEYREKKRL